MLEGTVLEIQMDWPGVYFDQPMMRLYLIAAIGRSDATGTALRILHRRFRTMAPARVVRERVA